MNINYHDLFDTVIKSRDDKELILDEYEKNEIDYNSFNDLITPNHYVGSKK